MRNDGAGVDVYWDVHCVPHIFATSDADVFWAFGWAQASSHAGLLLRLYGQARGRAAEYWGGGYLRSDHWVALMGVRKRAQSWLVEQSEEFRGWLEAFAAGINAYANAHSELIDPQLTVVLPVEAIDVVAHAQRVVNFSLLVDAESAMLATRAGERRIGSNAWAIAPSRSASGRSMLLTNPHMPWADIFVCFEAHLRGSRIDSYGIAPVGFPVLTMAFNAALGWSHTINAYRGWTLYELDTVPGGYRLDGEVHAFEERLEVLLVRRADGSTVSESLTLRRSVHGPVFERDGRTFALRIAGLDRPRALEQWWRMSVARSLSEFEAALQEMQIPMLTVLYADRDGHIMHFFNGQVPVRTTGDTEYWAGPVRGDERSLIWTSTHEYHELPRVLDPPSGWLQNANDAPWTTTFPAALQPDDFPPYMAPRGPMSLRAQRSARMLHENTKLSFEDVVRLKYSTVMELAERIRAELIDAARASGDRRAEEPARVLVAWDGCAEAHSRGAVLFAFWAQLMDPARLFETPWDAKLPLSTPSGLADPETAVRALVEAAEHVVARYGSIDVPWGDVFRLRWPGGEAPAIGADKLGVFPELWFAPTEDGTFVAVGGDCYTAVVEFSDPVRAMVLSTYGNATQAGRCSIGPELELFTNKKLRPALLTRVSILEHLAHYDRLEPA